MKREVTVQIFVRHTDPSCKQQNNSFTRSCDCPKYLRWSLNGRQYKEATGTRSYERAEELRRAKQNALRAGTVSPKAAEEAVKTIEWAYKLFLAEKETEGVSPDVYEKYAREIKRFVDFCNKERKFFPKDIDLALASQFRKLWVEWYPSSETRQAVHGRFKSFLRFMQEEGCLSRVPKLKPIKVAEQPTLPLNKEEYATLLATVGKVLNAEDAQKMHAVIQLMRHSGLAIGDAVRLERCKLIHDEAKGFVRVATTRQKTGTHVSIPLPPDVSDEILAVAALNPNPTYVFWNVLRVKSSTRWRQSTISGGWWGKRFRQIFRTAFGEDTHFTSHCLRDTFAVELLTAGVPLEEVSKALGHTSVKTTEKSYLPWVAARQNRLDSLIVGTWA